MSIYSILFDGLRDKLLDVFLDEQIKKVEEYERKEQYELEGKELVLRKQLKGWIENDIPIPNYIKIMHPFFVADYCVKANRADLVRDLLPMYNKQKKGLKKYKTAVNIVTGFSKTVSILLNLLIFFLIVLFIYSIFFGAPDFMLSVPAGFSLFHICT